jgi:hypothetical protein
LNNEPVAWRNLCVGNIGEDSEWIYNEIGQGEPLYTHPAKTLTDEEKKFSDKWWQGVAEFNKEKAQENGN